MCPCGILFSISFMDRGYYIYMDIWIVGLGDMTRHLTCMISKYGIENNKYNLLTCSLVPSLHKNIINRCLFMFC